MSLDIETSVVVWSAIGKQPPYDNSQSQPGKGFDDVDSSVKVTISGSKASRQSISFLLMFY